MWSDSQTNLELKVPEKFREIYDFKVLFDILGQEVDLFKESVLQYNKNLFVADADEQTLNKYAKMLGISGGNSEQTRTKIIGKISEIPPYSMTDILNVMERYTSSKCEIKSLEDYVLDVTYRGGVELADTSAVIADIYKIIPANILFKLHYDFIKYSDYLTTTYGDIFGKTWYDLKMGR